MTTSKKTTPGVGALDVVMPQYYRINEVTNRDLMDLAKPDLTNLVHMGLFRSFTVTGDTDLAVIGARNAINVCDTRNAGRGTKGSGFFAATGFQGSAHVAAFEAASTTCGTNVYGPAATPFQFTNKVGWDGIAPNSVSTLAAVASDARITLTWSTPAAAGDGDVPQYYQVYRSTTSPVARTWANLANKNFRVRGTQFVDQPNAGLNAANTYHYLIVGVDEYNNKSASNEASATVSFGSAVTKARSLAPGYSDTFANDSTANSSAAGNPVGGSRFSIVIGQKAIYRPAIATTGFYQMDVTTDGQTSHNANASWQLFGASESRNSVSNLLIRGTGAGNIGDVWGPVFSTPIYLTAAAAGSAQRIEFNNVDGNNISTARLNMDALRLRLVDRFPIREYSATGETAPLFQFNTAAGGLADFSLSAVTVEGYVEYSETPSNTNTVGLSTSQLIARKYTLESGGGLTFGTASFEFIYADGDLNGLSETGSSLNTVYKSNGVSATAVPGANVSFNYGLNTVTVSGQTGFSDWFLGSSSAAVADWAMVE